jgi:hypothetical protein
VTLFWGGISLTLTFTVLISKGKERFSKILNVVMQTAFLDGLSLSAWAMPLQNFDTLVTLFTLDKPLTLKQSTFSVFP